MRFFSGRVCVNEYSYMKSYLMVNTRLLPRVADKMALKSNQV